MRDGGRTRVVPVHVFHKIHTHSLAQVPNLSRFRTPDPVPEKKKKTFRGGLIICLCMN